MEGIFADKTCYFIASEDRYLLGLLNSRLLLFFFSNIAVQRQGGYFEYLTQYVEQLPIYLIDFDDPTDKARHNRMVALVEKMLDLHHNSASHRAEIKKTDYEIDRLVYDLYDLSEDEIVLIEQRVGSASDS